MGNEELSPVIKQSIDNIIKKEGFVSYDVQKKLLNADGSNYLGMIYEVDVKGKTNDGDKELNLFLKRVIPFEDTSIMNIKECFEKEANFYNNIAIKLNEFQNKYNVPDKERFKTIKSFGENTTEAIVLQNMVKLGFKSFNRMDYMTLDYTEMAVQELARFHGISFALQEKDPEYYETKMKCYKHPWTFNEGFYDFYKKLIKCAISKLSDDRRKKLEDMESTLLEKFKNYALDIENTVPCMVHADYRANNILSKEDNGEVSEVIIVDYQLMHYGCPILDLLFLIFLGTNSGFRRKHLTDLKNWYYESLAKYLQHYDIDVEAVFPREKFERIYKEKLDYGLLTAMYFGPFIYCAELPDFNLKDPNFNMNEGGHERIKEIYEDLIGWGYLE